MAATSLVRLFIVFAILIALALTSGIAWGSFSLFGDHDDREITIQSIEAPSWPFTGDADRP